MSFGKYTAFPHGSIMPQQLREGDVVQIDDGCHVDGYQSDITRTIVFGKPTQRQIDVWNLEHRAQAAAFAAAKPGAPCESVDAAARKVITDAGFGPGYKVPGLPHRTGHGIGLDGHEWTNFVRGNKTPLQPGMCFSDEPMIAIYGEFGIRLEDCLHITDEGAEVLHAAEPGDRPAVRVTIDGWLPRPRRRATSPSTSASGCPNTTSGSARSFRTTRRSSRRRRTPSAAARGA